MDGTKPWQLHYLSATHCAAPVTFGSELLLLVVGQLGVLPIVYYVREGDEINTKSRVADGGFALAWMVVPTIGKRVFLRVVSTIPTVMRGMMTAAATVKKSGLWPFKKSGFRRYKNSC